MFDKTATYTFVAPAGVDGRGGTAVLNDSTSSDFVGYLLDFSRSAPVRESVDNIVEGHGGVFGSFYYGPGAYTLEVVLAPVASGYSGSFDRRDKLFRATEAMATSGTLTFTESGGVQKRILFRRAEYPQGPTDDRKVMIALESADARVYAGTAISGANAGTNSGNASSPPTATFSPTANGTVNIIGTTAAGTVSLVVGSGYLVNGGGAVTVDFGARTVTQGGTSYPQAPIFPTSTWWEVIPGPNTWGFSGSSVTSASISFRSAWI